jgi:hypothetical protein
MRIQHTASLSSKNSLSTGSRRIQTRRHAALEQEQEQEQETMGHSHRILIMWARIQLALFGSSNWPCRSQQESRSGRAETMEPRRSVALPVCCLEPTPAPREDACFPFRTKRTNHNSNASSGPTQAAFRLQECNVQGRPNKEPRIRGTWFQEYRIQLVLDAQSNNAAIPESCN